MPGLDRTGPQGMGPMTGGARGLCNPAGTAYGRGMAYGRGFRGGFAPGRGLRRGFGAGRYPEPVYGAGYPADEKEELKMLKDQADGMKTALDEISRRISEIENRSE